MSHEHNDIPINYTKEAFLEPVNLGTLLVFTILGFVSGIIGFPVSLILTLLCAAELLYLGVVPKMSRFRKIIKLRKLKNRNSGAEQKDTFKKLGEDSKRKYLVLRRLVKLTKDNFDSMPYTSQGLLDSIRSKVDKLLSDYLMLLDLHKKYQTYAQSNIEKRLRSELKKEQDNIEEIESEKLRETKERRINILKKRLKKFDVAKEKYLICETHLETVNDAIRYVYEQSMTMNDPEEIGNQLDTLLMEIDETSSIIDELGHSPFINKNEMEIDELDVELEEAEKNNQAERTGEKVKN